MDAPKPAPDQGPRKIINIEPSNGATAPGTSSDKIKASCAIEDSDTQSGRASNKNSEAEKNKSPEEDSTAPLPWRRLIT